MDSRRRFFLTAVIPGAAFAGATLLTARLAGGQSGHPVPTDPRMLPPNPNDPGTSPGTLPPRTKAILEANQKEIKRDIDQLFSLAQDLKTEAAKIDSSEVLSVAFIDKTQQVEKLAKRICDLARL